MAMSSATVDTTGNTKEWNILATADADTGAMAAIAHGFAVSVATDLKVIITPILGAAGLSNWSVTWDTTNVTLTKNAVTAGSGNAAAQLRLIVERKHSLTS